MFRSSIRNRLILSFLALIIVTMTILGSYILWFFYRYNMDRLTANLETQALITEQLLHHYFAIPAERAKLDTLVKELGTKIDLRVTIIDPNGAVLADSRENIALMENHLQRPEVMAALAGEKGTAIRYSSTLEENLLYVAIPMYDAGEIIGLVRTSTTLSHVEAANNRIRSALLLAFLATTLLAVAFSLRLARRYTAPLEAITTVARQMGEGLLDRRVHIRTGDEIEILGNTLNSLAGRLDDKVNEITAEKRKLEVILEHMDNAVILLDRYGKVTDANLRAIELFNISGTMLGQHNIQLIGNSQLDLAARDTLNTGHSRLINVKTNYKGNKRVFQVFLAPIINSAENNTSVLSVFHDITTLQELQERQSEFVANASHELKTPLTAIKGFAETLLDGASDQPELARNFANIIYTEAERMNRLVNDLLQLAKLDAAEYRQHISLEQVEIEPLVYKAVQELAPIWQEKSITVSTVAPGKRVSVIATADWVKQVLVNLLENSIKYTPSGGSITVEWWQTAGLAMVAIKDTGIGIPAKDLPYIFHRFYRVDRARARTAGGTGLGLAIVKHIIETLGGKIDVRSQVDVGTTFTFTLPVHTPPHET